MCQKLLSKSDHGCSEYTTRAQAKKPPAHSQVAKIHARLIRRYFFSNPYYFISYTPIENDQIQIHIKLR